MEEEKCYENEAFEEEPDISALDPSKFEKESEIRNRKRRFLKKKKDDVVKIKTWSVRDKERKEKSVYKNRPKQYSCKFMNDLRQQKLKQHSPIFTPAMVIGIVFIIGLFCIAVSIILWIEVKSLEGREFQLDYSHINETDFTLTMTIPKDLDGEVYFYYRLDNFPQNARDFMLDPYFPYQLFLGERNKKPWFEQFLLMLNGGNKNFAQLCQILNKMRSTKNRGWFDTDWITDEFDQTIYKKPGKKLFLEAPGFQFYFLRNFIYSHLAFCGAAYNSMFFDSFEMIDEHGEEVPMTIEGINLDVDKKYIRNPPIPGNLTDPSSWKEFFIQCPIVQSECKQWPKRIWELDLENPENNGLQNAHFLNWRRSSSHNDFRKLYKRLNRTKGDYEKGLPKGNYTVKIFNHFGKEAIAKHRLKKYFIVGGEPGMGIRGLFLPIAYLLVGIVCLLTPPVLVLIHKRYGKNMEELAMNIPEFCAYRDPASTQFY